METLALPYRRTPSGVALSISTMLPRDLPRYNPALAGE
jgi:hypothetical protein